MIGLREKPYREPWCCSQRQGLPGTKFYWLTFSEIPKLRQTGNKNNHIAQAKLPKDGTSKWSGPRLNPGACHWEDHPQRDLILLQHNWEVSLAPQRAKIHHHCAVAAVGSRVPSRSLPSQNLWRRRFWGSNTSATWLPQKPTFDEDIPVLFILAQLGAPNNFQVRLRRCNVVRHSWWHVTWECSNLVVPNFWTRNAPHTLQNCGGNSQSIK